ncbi:hypothetical protein LTR02_000568 [Friedmanniomyces endolithicus]|nr:hypothetical protein LTR94_008287 [Friedmanniomyces endolithicus]KAK0792338.1 hypothetical protein LTR59_008540 [Friedmanniomyces endolithicus]KAK0815686.1 hypothetical protein LTR38_002332 [Friedmanniomyces endolithicus]KAK0821297.1 hypothetical protein LTR75_000770 [Friedmanniomyces endolithicus]KAK0841269.1 hypothetical protein LTR03_010053 [Friedmanniomyces endolithicus]
MSSTQIPSTYPRYWQPSIIRFGILLLLFDVYLTWARIEKATPGLPLPPLPPIPGTHDSSTTSSNSSFTSSGNNNVGITNFLATQPVLLQYLFFLLLCTAETLAFHLPIRTLLSLSSTATNKIANKADTNLANTNPANPSPSLISTALLISSFPKLFPLLLLIWPYDLPSSASAVSWAVIVNNVAALEILLGCGCAVSGGSELGYSEGGGYRGWLGDFCGGDRGDGDEYWGRRWTLGEGDGMELMA